MIEINGEVGRSHVHTPAGFHVVAEDVGKALEKPFGIESAIAWLDPPTIDFTVFKLPMVQGLQAP
jgi:hypothetical protein